LTAALIGIRWLKPPATCPYAVTDGLTPIGCAISYDVVFNSRRIHEDRFHITGERALALHNRTTPD